MQLQVEDTWVKLSGSIDFKIRYTVVSHLPGRFWSGQYGKVRDNYGEEVLLLEQHQWPETMTDRVKIVNEPFDRAYNCTKNHSGHRLFGKHSSQSETSSGLIVLTTNGWHGFSDRHTNDVVLTKVGWSLAFLKYQSKIANHLGGKCMEPRRCHAENNYWAALIRAHDLVIRVHGLVIRAHGLVIRAHGLA